MFRSIPWASATLVLAFVALGCGSSKKPAKSSDDSFEVSGEPKKDDSSSSGDTKPASGSAGTASAGGEGAPAAPKKDECTGFEIGNLEDTLGKVSCEVEKADDKQIEPKDRLDVTVSGPQKVTPGQHADLIVTIKNKTKAPMPLFFTIDPLPRFEVETYDAKNHRVDMPTTQPPPLPKGVTAREPGTPKTARVTLAPNGSAHVRVGWDAVRMKWAPEKVRGTPPERGYPRTAAGPLPKGKYTVRVVTPLVNVVEGAGKEVSAPKVPIEVSK
jgi:hypothetical protein